MAMKITSVIKNNSEIRFMYDKNTRTLSFTIRPIVMGCIIDMVLEREQFHNMKPDDADNEIENNYRSDDDSIYYKKELALVRGNVLIVNTSDTSTDVYTVNFYKYRGVLMAKLQNVEKGTKRVVAATRVPEITTTTNTRWL